MRRFLPLLLLVSLFLFRCASQAPAPVAAPEPVAEAAPVPVVEAVIGNAQVTASALNVRTEPKTDATVVVQVKKGTRLGVLRESEGWTRVRLADGQEGWVASRFVAREGEKKGAQAKGKGKKGCLPDSDFAFTETPALSFSDSGARGTVVVDATVNTSGSVTATKVLSNSTGDDALAFLAEKEIRSAKFTPPIRNCVARSFIFTYRRDF